jgi:beta-glucanase (GH16 family)
MKGTRLKFVSSFLVMFVPFYGLSQLVTGSCVHGEGISYLSDAYLASMGACSCERSGVILTSFPKCQTGPFIIEFEDNFEEDSIDLTKWELPGGQGALDGAQNVGVITLSNVSVSNGICFFTDKKETITKRLTSWKSDSEVLQDGRPNLRAFDYTFGMVRTKKTFLYGKYEIKCRMPKGNGFWPAFWTFGGQRWNEIDFFDNYAGTTEFITSLGHDFEGRGTANGCSASRKGYDFSEWHTFACIFDYDKITNLIDGEIVREVPRVITVNRKPVYCGDEIDAGTYYQLKAYPIEPMNIIVGMGLISKNGPGKSVPIDDTTPFPSSLEVDYIRYWKRVEPLVSIYPNPGPGKVNIFSITPINSVEIFNISGLRIYKLTNPPSSIQVDLSTQPDGFYTVSLELEGAYKTLKFVKITP